MKWIEILKRKKINNSQHSFPEFDQLLTEFFTQSSLDTSETVLELPSSESESLTYFRFILNRLGVAVWEVDWVENKVTFVSEKIQEIFEMPATTITIDTWEKIVHKDDTSAMTIMYDRLQTEERITHSYRVITSKGKVKLLTDTIIAIRDSTGSIVRVFGSIEELTQSNQLKQQINHITYHDELTNIPNVDYGRKFLTEILEENNKKNKTFALFCINLDGFSRINDTLGFKIGDEAIKQISHKLSIFVSSYGFLFRSQGDEWGAIINKFKKRIDYYNFAKNIIDVIQEPIHIDEYDIHIDASVGISIYPDDGGNQVDLFKNAHTALKHAKKIGFGNYQMYSASMNVESFKYLQLEIDLHNAIKKNQLYIEYQPKIDVKTQRATSAEALLRWKHPIWGEVSPAEFITISEDTTIHQEIADFVIDCVCKQVGEWGRQGVSFQTVSLNLSPKDFLKRTLVDQIKTAVDKYDVSPELLEIEITEGALLENTTVVHEQVTRLQELGIKLALDDFGTGYSSIHYLKQLPVSTVKIDRSFIQHLPQNEEDVIIVKSIINLSKGLKKKVVAEGVETEEQYLLLQQLGCDEIQGYYYSKSISGPEMKKWFQMEHVQPKKKEPKTTVNRRKYFRVDFPLPLSTQMTILTFNDKKVSLGSTEVMVQDMGAGGLRFLSHLRMLPNENIIYGFETEILQSNIKLSGKVVWYQEKDQGIFEYGVTYTISDPERSELSVLLNAFSLKLRADPNFREGNFVAQNPITYLKEGNF
jgi:diguanylate cyclase (GGDEF)-like protein/PAS domain S-box-containing protein